MRSEEFGEALALPLEPRSGSMLIAVGFNPRKELGVRSEELRKAPNNGYSN